MKITAISVQVKDPNRVSVSVDGKYRFSLDIYQVTELGLRLGNDYSEEELVNLENESVFGKAYARALEYSLVRPRSVKEVRDYLYKKTRDQRTKLGTIRKGIPLAMTERILDRLIQKGYVDDEKFTRYWVENRSVRKGVSKRKIEMELRAKGVTVESAGKLLEEAGRSEQSELQKVIDKKRNRYPDDQKLMQYLARQGFSYDDIKDALSSDN